MREQEAGVSRLVREHRRLVEFAVSRFLKRHPATSAERDDLVSWGLLGLLSAARAWDASRGLAFSTLAMPAIERTIARGARADRRPGGRTVSLDALLSAEREDGAGDRHVDQLVDDGPSVEERIVCLELGWRVRQAIAELTPEQQWLVRRRFFERRTLQEIAAEAGTSRQAIHQREVCLRRLLRRKLGAEGLLPTACCLPATPGPR